MYNHPLNADIHNFKFSLVFRASWHPSFDSSSFLIDNIVMKGTGRGQEEEESSKSPSRHKMCFALQLMKLFYYSNCTLVSWLDLLWNEVITHICPIGLHLSSRGGFILAGWKQCQWFPFLFKAAFGTLAECLMVCVQRKGTCHKLEKYFFNLKYVAVDLYVHIYTYCLYVFIYTWYMYVCMNVHIYMYISEAIELLNLPPSFLKTKIAFSNIQHQSDFPSFHLPVNSSKNQC